MKIICTTCALFTTGFSFLHIFEICVMRISLRQVSGVILVVHYQYVQILLTSPCSLNLAPFLELVYIFDCFGYTLSNSALNWFDISKKYQNDVTNHSSVSIQDPPIYCLRSYIPIQTRNSILMAYFVEQDVQLYS